MRRSPLVHVLLLGGALLAAQPGHADLADVVNDIRRVGCERREPAGSPVRNDAALDSAARLVASGTTLGAALEQAGFRARSSALVNLGGVNGDAAIREVLADGFCDSINNEAFSAYGTFARGNQFWLVLAEPFVPADPGQPQAVAARVLDLVNSARAQARRCGGGRRLPAVPPLELSAALNSAAAAHSNDMADHDRMEHRGSDGSDVGARANRSGYRWRAVGENIAAGQRDAEAVVQSWLDSPGHCANIMDPRWTEMGVAFALAPDTELRTFWTQVFAAPR